MVSHTVVAAEDTWSEVGNPKVVLDNPEGRPWTGGSFQGSWPWEVVPGRR